MANLTCRTTFNAKSRSALRQAAASKPGDESAIKFGDSGRVLREFTIGIEKQNQRDICVTQPVFAAPELTRLSLIQYA